MQSLQKKTSREVETAQDILDEPKFWEAFILFINSDLSPESLAYVRDLTLRKMDADCVEAGKADQWRSE
jgi:hypothetical protein